LQWVQNTCSPSIFCRRSLRVPRPLPVRRALRRTYVSSFPLLVYSVADVDLSSFQLCSHSRVGRNRESGPRIKSGVTVSFPRTRESRNDRQDACPTNQESTSISYIPKARSISIRPHPYQRPSKSSSSSTSCFIPLISERESKKHSRILGSKCLPFCSSIMAKASFSGKAGR
jgi:hypothetical protein